MSKPTTDIIQKLYDITPSISVDEFRAVIELYAETAYERGKRIGALQLQVENMDRELLTPKRKDKV